MAMSKEAEFSKYVEERYKGKVHRMERMYRPDFFGFDVRITFRIPDGGVDELELYRRINKVIAVIVEGKEDGTDLL